MLWLFITPLLPEGAREKDNSVILIVIIISREVRLVIARHCQQSIGCKPTACAALGLLVIKCK
jgi:hypothetical protein